MSKIGFSFSFLILSFTLIAQNKPVAYPREAVMSTVIENFWNCELFYKKAKDKNRAIRDVLEIVDSNSFLQASRYPDKFK
jgi:hypothetical protein